MPNSLIRFETEYMVKPKTPVTASIAANKPITPRLAVATLAGNNTNPSASGQLWNAIGLHPEKTPLGRLHQRSVKELLN